MTTTPSPHLAAALSTSPAEAALSLSDVSVERSGRTILDGVSIALAPATLTCLVGPNGSGKTTLLRTASGLIEPLSGRVEISGRALRSLTRRHIAREIAYVPQSSRPSFDFSVAELVSMGRYPHEPLWSSRGHSRSQAGDAAHAPSIVRTALEQTDTLELAGRSVQNLSGGELQRVLIARCLAAESKVLLLDEPTSHLDLAHALELFRLCRELRQVGRALLVAVHDLNVALDLADEVVVLDEGRVVAAGPTSEVLTAELIREVFGVDVVSAPERPPLSFELP